MYAIGSKHRAARRLLRIEALERRDFLSADLPAVLAAPAAREAEDAAADVAVEDMAETVVSAAAIAATAETASVPGAATVVPAAVDALFSGIETSPIADGLAENNVLLRSFNPNTPPEAFPMDDVWVDEDSDPAYIDLGYYFYDAEDPYYALTYEIESNSNPDLFDSACADGYGGLVLDFAENAYGDAELTIRATDTGGLWVETTLNVHVVAINDAPVIHNFVGTAGTGDVWTFSGTVTDVDDSVQGWQVSFGGILSTYGYTATVNADGTFEIIQQFPNLQSGMATASTSDPHGLQSALASYEVFVT